MAKESHPLPVVLASGDPVLVRTRFDGSWADGFVIHAESEGGYLVQRASDQSVLPIVFDPEELWPARGLAATDWEAVPSS